MNLPDLLDRNWLGSTLGKRLVRHTGVEERKKRSSLRGAWSKDIHDISTDNNYSLPGQQLS
jgi:hypothetical protein